MDFIVAGRQDIEQGVLVRTAYVVVSITDPGTRRPRVRRSAGFRDALYLKFHDAVPSESTPLPADVVVMTEEHAKKIWDFVLRYQDQVNTVVVHCEQGMSRSPAIAAALCVRLGTDSERFFQEYQPNQYIYDLMGSCFPGDSRPLS